MVMHYWGGKGNNLGAVEKSISVSLFLLPLQKINK